jgi:hypothetical protein
MRGIGSPEESEEGRKRPFSLDRHTNHRIYTANVELSAMGEGRVLLCGIAFALLPVYASLRAFQLPCRSHRRGIWCVKGVWSA